MFPSDLGDRIKQSLIEQIRSLNSFNLAIIGASGVGKTTLANAFFPEINVSGKTKEITKYSNGKLTIYDCIGFENDIKLLQKSEKGILNLIKECSSKKELKDKIHCIWYCINPESKRFNQGEINFIKKITNQTTIYNIPVIIVLTQAYDTNSINLMKSMILNESLKIVNIVPVLVKDRTIPFGTKSMKIDKYGTKTLFNEMKKCISEKLLETLICIQKVSLEDKRSKSILIILGAIGATFLGRFIDFTAYSSLIKFGAYGIILAGMTVGISICYDVTIGFSFISCIFEVILLKMPDILKYITPEKIKFMGNIAINSFPELVTFGIGVIYFLIIDWGYTNDVNFNAVNSELKKIIGLVVDAIIHNCSSRLMTSVASIQNVLPPIRFLK